MKKTMVLFSGGLDSTLALLYTLKYNPANTVTVVSFKMENNPIQAKREEVARERIIQHIEAKGCKLDAITLSVGFGCVYRDPYLAIMTQPMTWAYMVPMAYHSYLEYSCIVAGYIKDDCFWHIREGWETMVKGGLMMLSDYTDNTAENVMPRFHYPLRLMTKKDIVDALITIDKDLLSMVWWCEQTGDEELKHPCGKCPSCLKMISWGFNDLNNLIPTHVNPNEKQTDFLDTLDTFPVAEDISVEQSSDLTTCVE